MIKTVKQAHKVLKSGKNVKLTVRRLRGYIYGDTSLVLKSKHYGSDDRYEALKHKVKCFRYDEAPYDNVRWEVLDA